jgi:hypothetical protein
MGREKKLRARICMHLISYFIQQYDKFNGVLMSVMVGGRVLQSSMRGNP